jgi:ATP-dependent RNA helicase DeaD
VADALIKDGYNADALHGDLSQAQRDFVMKRYRSRSLQMLVATDVAARGIDVNDVTHVINYNLPDEIESYTHRSGRTARAGKTGVSIAIIHSKELHKIREIEKIIKRKFTQAQIPTGFDVCEQQLMALVKRIHNVEVDEKTVERYLPQVFEELAELSREDIIKRFVSIEFNRFAEYYRNAPDLNHNAQRDDRRALAPGVVKLYMNIGGIDGFDFNTIKEFVSENAEIAIADITWTDIKNTFSLIEVKNEAVDKIMEAIHGAQYRGRTVRVESRGNRDAGIPRTRFRGDKRQGGGGGGGFHKGKGKEGGFDRKKSYGDRDGGFNKKKKKY